MFRADLHCHTNYSDGTFSPEELIAHACSIGLSGLSITDHDTISAYKEAKPLAKASGLLLGTGGEFSCTFQQISVHILGYDFDLDASEIIAFCSKHKERRYLRNRRILKKLSAIRMPIEEGQLETLENTGKVIGRPHIAQLMINKGYVKDSKEAFERYIGDGKIAYDSTESFSVEESISIIHAAKGKAFLAHPHLLAGGDRVQRLLNLPFDGIECYYARCQPDQVKRWVKMAQKKHLLMSGGSDFHGATKPGIPLGVSWVDETLFRQIFQRSI